MKKAALKPDERGGRGSPDPKGLEGIPPLEEIGVGHDSLFLN